MQDVDNLKMSRQIAISFDFSFFVSNWRFPEVKRIRLSSFEDISQINWGNPGLNNRSA